MSVGIAWHPYLDAGILLWNQKHITRQGHSVTRMNPEKKMRPPHNHIWTEAKRGTFSKPKTWQYNLMWLMEAMATALLITALAFDLSPVTTSSKGNIQIPNDRINPTAWLHQMKSKALLPLSCPKVTWRRTRSSMLSDSHFLRFPVFPW